MKNFFVDVLKFNMDGTISLNEAIAIAIGVIALFIVFYIVKKPILDFINRITPGRKKTIFSHRKNQYKTRIGKKSKAPNKKK